MNNLKSLLSFSLYCLLIILLYAPAGIRADAPRDVGEQKDSGKNADAMEDAIKDVIENKEILDIGFAAYIQGRPGENIPPDPYVGFLNKHRSFFCSPTSGLELAAFRDKGCDSDKSAATEYGDIKLSGLLAPTNYDEAQQIVAEEVIRNLINPFPTTELKQLISNPKNLDDQSNKKKFGNFFANQAALTAARYTLNEMFALRLSGELVDSGDNVSVMKVLENEAGARFKNSEWYDKLSDATSTELSKELVQMEAFRLWMEYHRLRSAHRQEVLLAILLANTINVGAKQSEAFSAAANESNNLYQ